MLRYLLWCLWIFTATHAGLTVEITGGQAKAFPIAILDFEGDPEFAPQTSQIIRNNLRTTGLFEVIPPASYIQTDLKFNETPRFKDWQMIQARALVVGSLKKRGNHLEVHFQVFDTHSELLMVEGSFKTKEKYWRRLGHLISDVIYKRITGEDGYFDTKIVYVAEQGPQQKRERRLAIMDQDGANHKFLTDGKIPVITPRFSPASHTITYMEYEPGSRLGKVCILDLETGRHEIVGHFPGITYAPRFSPTGEEIILTQALKGRSSLHVMNLKTKKVRQLTQATSIDTSPSYSPDGSQIVFNSDRGKKKHLYVMNADGTNVRRISFGEGVYATPVWSPKGDWIAFTALVKGKFHIGIMRPDGSEEQLISDGFLVEGPAWAPNGRTLIFYNQQRWGKDGRGGKARLYTIHITGNNKREVLTPGDASDPAWSPYLPLVGIA